jgi:glycosyltransferase involved in cell wall biosynthesis
MHWNIVSPYQDTMSNNPEGEWLLPYLPKDRHNYSLISRRSKNVNWHERSSPVTDYREWLNLWEQSRRAVTTCQGGMVTILPQLASVSGLQQRFFRPQFPLVAWWFNTNLYKGYKRWLASAALKHVNRFTVHNRREREVYSQWLGVPINRFEFVPMPTRILPITEQEDTERPFILSVGSAFRDYPLLFEAVKKLGLRTIVASGPKTLEGLEIPSVVEVPLGIKNPEILSLTQRARLAVLPLRQEGLIAGTVAAIEALSLGCPLIATDRPGPDDYIQHGKTGLLVRPNSLTALVEAIDHLWHDDTLRGQMRKQSRQYAEEQLTPKAAGAALGHILDQVANEWEHSPQRLKH